MKIAGNATLHAPADRVYAALNDPNVLAATIPGCQALEAVGPDAYAMTVAAGVASIKGVYQGQVSLLDQQPPGSFRLKASGAGAPGTVSADVLVTLADGGDGTTRLEYDADAVVGGMVGGVGQRMLTGVAKKTAGEFFRAVDGVLTGATPVGAAPAPAAAGPSGADRAGAAVSAAGQPEAAPTAARFTPPTPAPGGDSFFRGAVFGAAVALLGVLAGGILARRP